MHEQTCTAAKCLAVIRHRREACNAKRSVGVSHYICTLWYSTPGTLRTLWFQLVHTLGGGGGMCSAATERNVVKMWWYYVVICDKICGLLAINFFSKHMALDGQFYFLVLLGWMPSISEGFHACYESLTFNGHKQTTTLSVYVNPSKSPLYCVMKACRRPLSSRPCPRFCFMASLLDRDK